MCACTPQWTGDLCDYERKIEYIPCTKVLRVFLPLVDQTTTIGSSTLSPGTAGAPCPTNPCLNGATCSLVTGGGFICNCIAGFSGLLCDIPGS